MSHWPQWPPVGGVLHSGGAAQPPAGIIPANIATSTYPPQSLPGAANTGMQYPPEQWTQMQQQSWQQWAQWQQQYQHWHQQYGAEYHRSLNALATNTPMGMPNTSNNPSLPPPLPNDTQPPPPPPPSDDISGDIKISNNVPLRSGNSDYSTTMIGLMSPSNMQQQPYCNTSLPPPMISQQSTNQLPRNFNQHANNWQTAKRPYSQVESVGSNNGKRHMLDSQGHWTSKPQQQSTPSELQFQEPQLLASQTSGQIQKLHNLEELIEAEKKFDKEFPAWEAQFNKWKEQNSNHPDKMQFLQYEKQWESWRNSFLERRAQMRKKRMMLESALPQQQQHSSDGSQSDQLKVTPPDIFTNQNTVNSSRGDSSQEHFSPSDIFNSSSVVASKTIPGLDLVKDSHKLDDGSVELEPDLDRNKTQKSKGPDLDAISQGINNILGDTKLMNILSKVTSQQAPNQYQQNHQSSRHPMSAISDLSGDISQPPPPLLNQSHFSAHNGSNQSSSGTAINDEYNGPESRYNAYGGGGGDRGNGDDMINVDDQTRMSFSNCPLNNNLNQFGADVEIANVRHNNNNNNNGRSSFGENSRNGKFGDKGRNNFKQDSRFDRDEYRNFDNQYIDNFSIRNKSRETDNFAGSPFGCEWDDNSYDGYHRRFEENDRFDKLERRTDEIEFDQRNSNYSRSPPPPHMSQAPIQSTNDIFEPEFVIEYEHKPIITPEISLEISRMFDYRHKPVNRIPLPQRPAWLLKTLTGIRQFNPLGMTLDNQYDHRGSNRAMMGDGKRDTSMRFHPMPGGSGRGGGGFPSLIADDHSQYAYQPKTNLDQNDECHNFGSNKYDNSRSRSYNKENSNKSNQRNFDRSQRCQANEVYNPPLELDELSDDEGWGKSSSPPTSISTHEHLDRDNMDNTEYLSNAFNSANTAIRTSTTLEDLINFPGRHKRPSRIVIILRGPPGSGKTYLAKLIKDREVENGGSAPRILSLDDYFMVEQEKEITTDDGKQMKIKEMVYEYEKEMEESYRLSLIKSFKKTITDGYFNFIIIDNVNQKVRSFGETWSFAKQNGFQVYVCQLDLDPQLCTKRNIHNRTQSDIEDCIAGWEPTPLHHPVVDATSFLQSSGPITEVEMEEINQNADMSGSGGSAGDEGDNDNDKDKDPIRSKWDTFDCSLNNLAKLDGVSKPLRRSTTMEEYLQYDHESEEDASEDEWRKSNTNQQSKFGRKKVRWADLEEQKEQKKMKALGFIVGQTDWNRMMDPTNGESALRQTKYIERINKY